MEEGEWAGTVVRLLVTTSVLLNQIELLADEEDNTVVLTTAAFEDVGAVAYEIEIEVTVTVTVPAVGALAQSLLLGLFASISVCAWRKAPFAPRSDGSGTKRPCGDRVACCR